MSIYTGKTVNAAIQAGLNQLRIKRAAADVRILQTSRKGFLGIGRRRAKVEISRKTRSPVKSARSQSSTQPVQHPDHHNQDHSASFTIKQRQTPPLHFKRRPQSVKIIQHTPARHPDRRQQNRIAIQKLEDYLGKIIHLLGIHTTMQVTFPATRQVRINFKTNKEGLLIGKHGLTINALQALSEIFLNRMGLYHLYVELDTADYRERRMEVLGRLAKKTAREAVATGKPVYLDPMPSFERKKIHKTLEDSEHVMTYSAGREPYRAVVVAPK